MGDRWHGLALTFPFSKTKNPGKTGVFKVVP
ncbi:hypothetical protein ACSSV1_000166 [Labrenzia sp. MBR-25]|jgi:hypothetical protein